jgi:hypothetical protein
VGTWLDKKIDGPAVKVAIGMVLGPASIFSLRLFPDCQASE